MRLLSAAAWGFGIAVAIVVAIFLFALFAMLLGALFGTTWGWVVGITLILGAMLTIGFYII